MSTFLKILAAVFVLMFVSGFVCWRAGRVLRRSLHRDRALDTVTDGLPPAAPDNQPGFNLADHDECALILHATTQNEAQLAAGCARLLDAIHEHRKEQEG